MRDEQRFINLILESIYEMSEADKPKKQKVQKDQSGKSRGYNYGNVVDATCFKEEVSVDEVNAVDPKLGISQQSCWNGVHPIRVITRKGLQPNDVKRFITQNDDLLKIDVIKEKYGENFSIDDFMEKYFHPNERIRGDLRNLIAQSSKFERRQEYLFGTSIEDRENKFIIFRPIRDTKNPVTGNVKSHKNLPGWKKYLPVVKPKDPQTKFYSNPETGERITYKVNPSELSKQVAVRDESGSPIIDINPDSPYFGNIITMSEEGNLQVSIWSPGANPDVDPPSFFKVKEGDMEFLYYPLKCNDVKELLENKELLEKLDRIRRINNLNLLFHDYPKCFPQSGIQSKPKIYGQFLGIPGSYDYGKKVDYPEDVDYPIGKRRTGKKDSTSKTIAMIFNKMMAKEFAIKGPTFNLFEKKGLPPIIFAQKNINTYIDLTNEDILYQGINNVDYGSKEALVRKVFNRAMGKKYDQALVKTVLEDSDKEQIFSILDINFGDKVRFDVQNDYSGPREEGATLRLYAMKGGPVEKLTGKKTATTATTSGDISYGKQNWIQGEIVAYDNNRQRITIKVREKQGTGSSSYWMIEYEESSMFYEPRQFNTKYRHWEPDRSIQFDLNNATNDNQASRLKFDDETKSRYEGVTPIYGLGASGYRNTNPEVTFRLFWEIGGERNGDTFDWSMIIKTQMGIKDPSNPTGNVIFKPFKYELSNDDTAYQLNLNNENGQIYNDGIITSVVSVDLDEMADVEYGNTWIYTTNNAKNIKSLNRRFQFGDLISTEDYEKLTDDERTKFRIYTIMDNFKVSEGLKQLFDDIKSKVEALDPQQALIAVNPEERAEPRNLQEQIDNIVKNIIREIRRNK